MTAPVEDPWVPDPHLIDSALAGNLSSRTLTGPDRAWVVAGLAARGITAEHTASLLDCSLRTVRAIRAEPMTRVCVHAMELVVALDDALDRNKGDRRAHQFELEDARATAERYRSQRDELIEAIRSGQASAFRCGHPRVRYNSGKRSDGYVTCLTCHRDRQAKYRATNRSTPQVEGTPQ